MPTFKEHFQRQQEMQRFQKDWERRIGALSDEAKCILGLMGQGHVLRVSKDGCSLLPSKHRAFQFPEPVEGVWVHFVNELKASGFITQLTENRNGSRMGWKEMELDGSGCELWVCTQ